MERDSGILLLGFPRSGTTLMRRLLNAHPALCCPPETNLLNACGRFLYEEDIVRGLRIGTLSGLAYSDVEPEEVIGGLRDLVFGILDRIRDREGKRRWVDKSPYDMFHLDAVERICGERCHYICLVRHPLDVVCSTKDLCDEMEIFPLELHHYVRRHSRPLEAFAHAWADTHRHLLRFQQAHSDRCVRLRYEDLIADPPRELARVLDFLGEPTDTEELAARAMRNKDTVGLGDWKTYRKSRIERSSVARWQKLSADTVARLTEIVGPVMREYGYEPPVVEPESDERARRMQQISMMVSRLKSESRE